MGQLRIFTLEFMLSSERRIFINSQAFRWLPPLRMAAAWNRLAVVLPPLALSHVQDGGFQLLQGDLRICGEIGLQIREHAG